MKTKNKEKTFTFEEVIIITKAFHLDSVQGRYNNEIRVWSDK